MLTCQVCWECGRDEGRKGRHGPKVLSGGAIVDKANLVGELDRGEQLECREGIESQTGLWREEKLGVSNVLRLDAFEPKGADDELFEVVPQGSQRVWGGRVRWIRNRHRTIQPRR